METIVNLTHARHGFGGKAAHLSALLNEGFAVPDGFAIAPDASLTSLATHLDALGDVPLAVRSSAFDEDGAAASFAGIYDSVLDVRGFLAVQKAIEQVRASALSPRALAYRDDGQPVRMGVVVQRLVRADCAGVMFTADPVTGDRDARVISAVHGLGEELVSGEQTGEEWVVRAGKAVRRRALPQPVLTEAQVLALVEVGEKAAARFGGPQDIEWVIEDGRITLVQTRPITALPERVEWSVPDSRAFWLRNFRWGEWLSDPVSPLFATWFFPRAEAIFEDMTEHAMGLRTTLPRHRIVNGWYFYSPLGEKGMRYMLGALFRHPLLTVQVARSTLNPAGSHPFIEHHERLYEQDIAPRHRVLAAESVGDTPASLIDYIDRVCDLHGELMSNFALVGGFAWKAEAALAKFFRAHCESIEGAPHELLAALSPVGPCASHLACSLDWMHPTAGELGLAGATTPVRGDAAARREALEHACLASLAPKLRKQFERLLRVSQKYARIREIQAHDLTLAWPKVRSALRKLGQVAHEHGAIDAVDDVFWLHREELDDALCGTRRFLREVGERRADWERHRKLAPPLEIGKRPGMMGLFDDLVRNVRGGEIESDEATLVGVPASAGRATGKVRIVMSPEDFGRLQEGEVLVAPTTAPAWTPLFSRAVAVVTNGGSLAAHASLVAREYGIPAVVATVHATQRLHDGQLVTVDGTTGRVELLEGGDAG